METSRGNDIEVRSRDIVVIGGSAGAIDAMARIVKGLPEGYSGSILIVSHIGAHPSQLPELLAQAGRLPAHHARHQQVLRPGCVYVAPPDRHLILSDGRMLLSTLPREHFTRPAIDPLFRSAAKAYGRRVVGVLLSGTGSDGTLGLQQIAKAGGVTVVQDPAEATFPQMPETALRVVTPDHVVPSAQLAPLLLRLIEEPVAVSETEDSDVPGEMDLEAPSALTCPECGGAVREVPGVGLVAYRCHIGHQFNGDELLVQQTESLERAIMVAIRVLRERGALSGRMIKDAQAGGRSYGVAHWTRLKDEADEQLKVLQQFLDCMHDDEEVGRGASLAGSNG